MIRTCGSFPVPPELQFLANPWGFERQSRVEGQLRREAYRRLRQAGIAFPHLRYEVSPLGGEAVPGVRTPAALPPQ